MEEGTLSCRLADLYRHIVENDKPVIVFGTGKTGCRVQRYFEDLGHPITLFIDNDTGKQGTGLCSTMVASPSEGVRQHPQGFFVIANLKAEQGRLMSRQLEDMGVAKGQIFSCTQWTMHEMRNSLRGRYVEDKNLIYHDPMRRDRLYCLKKIKASVKMVGYKVLMNIVCPRRGPEKRYDVAICAIFKNEARYLKEWIEYHKIVGIQHFYLYNNCSEDHYAEVLEPYVRNGSVTVADWPHRQGQMGAYRDCVRRYKDQCRWIGFIDLDEFVLPIRDNNIYGFLRGFEKNRGSVLVYWKVFGSAGRLDRDPGGLVTEDFTVCWERHSDVGKCFFNTRYSLPEDDGRNHILHHQAWTEYGGVKFPPVNIFDRVCIDGFHSMPGSCSSHGGRFAVQINHYVTKSYAEYLKKIQGTDVFFRDNPHNEQAFGFHDEKCGAVDVGIYRYLPLLKQKMGRETNG